VLSFLLFFILKNVDFKQNMGFKGSFNRNYLRMKNLKRSFLLLALLAGLIYSCEKDSFEEAETIIPKITTAKVLDNIESVYNPLNIKEYTHNALDADDENINAQLLDIAIAAREYFKKYSQNEIIRKQANLSSNKCFNLNELASIN